MSVRAKFKVNSITRTSYGRSEKQEDGSYKNVGNYELQSIKMSPVYSQDPESENAKFWNSSPSGEITLGTINDEAAKQFELDGEYYVDFTKAA